MLLLRANTLALGHSGCRPLLVDRLLDFLRLGVHPVVPEQGSLGASGDLAPLAHLALPLIGRGQAEVRGQVVPALIALREAGLEPLTLEAKEGLALLNGTQMMGALGALLLADADRLVRTASVAAAMSVEALLGTDVAFAAAYQLARPHPGQVAGRRRAAPPAARQRPAARAPRLARTRSRTRTRCAACRRSTARSATRSTTSGGSSTSSSTRRPTTRSSSRAAASPTRTRSPPAAAGSSAAATSMASPSPSRSTSPSSPWPSSGRSASGGPRCSSTLDSTAGCRRSSPRASGVESGMMIYQYTAAALVSEHKVLAHPASADSIPTSANQEDHVSMGSIAARHARAILRASSGSSPSSWSSPRRRSTCGWRRWRRVGDDGAASAATPGAGVAEAHRRIRARIAHLDRDREPGPDLAAATALVHGGVLADLAGPGGLA